MTFGNKLINTMCIHFQEVDNEYKNVPSSSPLTVSGPYYGNVSTNPSLEIQPGKMKMATPEEVCNHCHVVIS